MAKKKKIDWDKFYSAYKNMKRVGNGTYRKLDIEGLGMVMDALQRKGFNDRQIEAILGNVVEESGGDPFAIAKGGVYKGLFQESNVRYPMKEFEKDKERFKGKKKEYIDYMIDRFYEHVNDSKYYTVKGTKYGRAKEAVKEFTSNGKNVDYSYPLVYAFEAPGDKEGTYKNRKSVSNIISKSYANDGSYEPSMTANKAEPKQNTNNNGFGAAFKEAKKKGLSEFVFNGKKYSTAVKEDGGPVLDDVIYMEDGGDIGLLDWIKKQDFVGRGRNLIKAILDPKGSVYKIMSNSGGNETMSLPDVIDILSKGTEGKYKGKSFDFPKMYIYGNDESAEELTDEEKRYGVDYSSYLNGRGIDPKTIKQYKGDFGYDIELPESLKENIINLIESGNNPTIGFEEFFPGVDEIEHDDVGGHLGRINVDPDGNLFMSYSDIWDFEPKFYSDFHNDPDLIGNKALSYAQSYLLDKVGTPFIVRSKKQIKFVPDENYGSKVEDDDAFRYSEEVVGAIKNAIGKTSTRTVNSSDQDLQDGGQVSDDDDKWWEDKEKRKSVVEQQNTSRKNQKNFFKLEENARKALEDGDIDEDEYRKIIGFSEDQIGGLIIEKSGEGEKAAEMINEMLNSGIDESAFAKGVGDAAKSQEEKRLDSLYNYKLMGNSLLTLAEIASASPAVLRILRSNGINLTPILEKIADNKKIQVISGLTGMAADAGQIILNPDDGNIMNYLGVIGNAAELLSGTKVGTKVGERLFENYDRETANDVFDLINSGISVGGVVGNMLFEDGGDIKQKQKKAYDYFTVKRGMSQIQAIAILGNLMAESNLKDDIHGDNGTSYGIQQWHNERKDALFKMAKKKGHDVPTFEDQLEFLADEYEGKTGYSNFLYSRKGKMGPGYYNYSRSDFQDAENLRDAVVAWNQGAGRPHKSVIRNSDRYSAALKVAKNLGFDFGLDAGAAPMYGQMGVGEDFIFHEEGDEPEGGAQPVSDTQAVSQQDTVSTTQEDMMKSWIEAYGKGIVAQLMATSGNNKVNTSVDDTTERYRDYVKESKDDEDSKRMALLQSFLPNIQLKIKGVTQVRGDQ